MRTYTIGDVSERLGISRDTLRFYEKKGIIKPQKQDNGYRCYSYDDIRTLMDILFFRRFNFSIDEIRRILHHGSYQLVIDLVEKKIEEEKKHLERHRQALTHLQYADRLYQNIGQYTNNYDIRPIPDFYIVDEDSLSTMPDVYDLCYIFEEYLFKGGQAELTNQHMMISAKTASIVKIDQKLGTHIFHLQNQCIYTVLESDSRSPSSKALNNIHDWALSHGYKPVGNIYSGYLLNCTKNGHTVYYIEVYLPLNPAHPHKQPGCH